MTGLIGWWPLNEDSGNTAYDLSGNGNHGSLNGGVTQGVAGKGGLTSYSFDGSDNYVDIPNNFGIFDGSVDFTISCWVRPHDLGDGSQNRVVNFGGENFVTIWEQNDTDNNQLALRINDGSNHYAKTDPLQNDEWVHIVAVFRSNDQFSIWRNGNREGLNEDGVSSISSTSGDSLIGARRDKDFFIDAEIADVRIYDRALSSEEIQELYDWGNGDFARPLNNSNSSSAVSRWAFDGDVTDSWGMNDGGASTSAGYSNDSLRGKSAKFNGTDDFVDVVDDSTLDIQNTITVSAWINTPKRQNRAAIVDKGGFDTYWVQKQTSDQLRFGIRDGGTAYYTDAGSSMWPENEWVHATGTFDGNRLRLYINGIEKSSTAHSGTIDTNNDSLQIGNSPSYDRAFEGKIDDVRIYDKSLSPSEVFELYRWGTRGRDLRKLTVNSR